MKTMGNNQAAIYLRKSTEDDGKSVAGQERELRTKAETMAPQPAQSLTKTDHNSSVASTTIRPASSARSCCRTSTGGLAPAVGPLDRTRPNLVGCQ